MLGILEKISPSELVSNGYISNQNKVRRPHPKFKVSFFLLFLNQCYQINFENITQKYKESFLIVVSSWNRDLMLMLERPLSHYWTSPLTRVLIFFFYAIGPWSACKYLHIFLICSLSCRCWPIMSAQVSRYGCFNKTSNMVLILFCLGYSNLKGEVQ